ncbi:hypothetical protein BY996DRAFT_7031971 [Phakopsora pachyrhizi]|uniref:Large ribosomal subunit protein mL49 n=1 Tax=Phakopsora pachyrhizi TaxID=170000 RepID=A0AAV0BSZ9_PHAPC|nr:hypothetical protein BY996DRAFT_7031971 [Phakopsora pachyrhizi]CAH7689828.1 hypothetical protein PPACK8108_LOCUS24973 [Phakopsora pachyrhizi]
MSFSRIQSTLSRLSFHSLKTRSNFSVQHLLTSNCQISNKTKPEINRFHRRELHEPTAPIKSETPRPPITLKPLPDRLWKAPLPTEGHLLSYKVNRTQPFNTLPVYTKAKPALGQIWTLVKKIDGDIHKLKEDLLQDFPKAYPILNLRTRQVLMRGKITREVKLWLQDRGF